MKKCKMCNKKLKKQTRVYCSNACKFSDSNYNQSRVSIDKNDKYKQIKCKICGWISSDVKNKSGCVSRHLKLHNITMLENYIEQFDIIDLNPNDYWHCHLCVWETLDINNTSGCIVNHLINVHNLSDDELLLVPVIMNNHSKKVSKIKEKQFLFEFFFLRISNILDCVCLRIPI